MLKRFFALLTALAVTVGMVPAAFGVKTAAVELSQAAEALKQMAQELRPAERETVKSGAVIRIAPGTELWKSPNDTQGPPYAVKREHSLLAEEVFAGKDGVRWCRFQGDSVDDIPLMLGGYIYVKAADCTFLDPAPTVPETEPAEDCTCGAETPEHRADCPRYEPPAKVIITCETPVSVEKTTEDKAAAIAAAVPELSGSLSSHFFDISSEAEAPAELVLSGMVSDPANTRVTVMHLLDTAEAIARELAEKATSGEEAAFFVAEGEALFSAEIAAAREAMPDMQENRVYYALEPAEVRENGDVVFTAESFSTFGFIVDFSFGGMKYALPGGSEVYLSEILAELGLARTGVADVKVSDPAVLSVKKENGDWLITALAPFDTEEYLTLTLQTGEVITIQVTDPALKYYLPGTAWDLGTETRTVTGTSGAALGGSYRVNKTPITRAEVEAVDAMTIYVRSGMLVGFEAGTTWKAAEGARPTSGDWVWAWDGAVNWAAVSGNIKSVKILEPFPVYSGTEKCDVTLIVVPEKTPSLLRGSLPSGYSIRELPITLYNYDGRAFNGFYAAASNRPYVAFSGTSLGLSANKDAQGNDIRRDWTGESNTSVNSGGSVALMGILEDTLQNGLPVMKAGQQVDLFGKSSNAAIGKTVHNNVGFEFLYNEKTGYYTYSSNLNHAQFNGSDKIRLYTESLAPGHGATASASHSNGGFYPFADIQRAFWNLGGSPAVSGGWEQPFVQKLGTYAADPVISGSITPASTVDLNFGLQFDVNFYLPSDGKVDADNNGTREEIVYNFTGDDDLWVFIDDKLVLDIGGGHTAVSGSINFTTGEVWVEKYSTLAFSGDACLCTVREQENWRQTFTFERDAMHNMKVFYLERHSGVSNCRMHFNIPILPANSVTVSKELKNQDGLPLSVTPDVDYTFRLMARNLENSDPKDDTFGPLKDTAYTVQGSDTPFKTDSEGYFTLKAGQTAVFAGIPRFTEVYAVEAPSEDGYVYAGASVSVNNAPAEAYRYDTPTETLTMQATGSLSFAFTNVMQTQPVTIRKNVVGGIDGLVDPGQQFSFGLCLTAPIREVQFTAQKDGAEVTLQKQEIFSLAHGQQLTIPRVPVNMSFTLREEDPDPQTHSFGNPQFTEKLGAGAQTTQARQFGVDYAYAVAAGGENRITVTNRQYLDLTINKRISGGKNPDESFLFRIRGTQSHNQGVDLYVILTAESFASGEASVQVIKLPVGAYRVEEDTAWGTHYQLLGDGVFELSGTGGTTQSVTFTNKQEDNRWLTDEAFAQNRYDGAGFLRRQGETSDSG